MTLAAGTRIAYAQGFPRSESQVFLQTLPDPAGGRWTVSPLGGVYPRWRRDGSELYFVDADGQLMSVSFGSRPRVEIGTPKPLFPLPVVAAQQQSPFDVAADGQRFVVIGPRGAPGRLSLTVLLDWMK